MDGSSSPTEAVTGKHHRRCNSQGNVYSITERQSKHNDDETAISELAKKDVFSIMEVTVPGGN
jgi:hypothetical protein